MAGASNTRFKFAWINDASIRHEIRFKHPTADVSAGDVISISTAADPPITIKRRATKTDGDITIIGSELTFDFYTTVDLLPTYDEFYQGPYKFLKCTLSQGGPFPAASTVMWTGYVKPENGSREFIEKDMKYRYSITSTDLIADLKKMEFADPSSNGVYADRVPIMKMIDRCLVRTDIDMDYKVQLSTYSNKDVSTAVSPFVSKELDTRRFTKNVKGNVTPTDCNTVLTEVLKPFNCSLMQSQNNWWIINYNELSSFTYNMTWQDPTPSHNFRQASNLVVDITNHTFLDRGILEYIAPLKRIDTTAKNKTLLPSSLGNGNFDVSTLDGEGDHWFFEPGIDVSTVVPFGSNISGDQGYEMQVLVNTTTAPHAPGSMTDGSTNFWFLLSPGATPDASTATFDLSYTVRNPDVSAFIGTEDYLNWMQVSVELYRAGNYKIGTKIEPELTESIRYKTIPYSLTTARKYKWKFESGAPTSYYFTFKIDPRPTILPWSGWDLFDLRVDDVKLVVNPGDSADRTTDKLYRTENTGIDLFDYETKSLSFNDGESNNDVGSVFEVADASLVGGWSRWNHVGEEKTLQELYNINQLTNRGSYKRYLRVKLIDLWDAATPLRVHQIWLLDGSHYRIIGFNETLNKKWRIISAELEEILTADIDTSTFITALTSEDGDTLYADGKVISNLANQPIFSPNYDVGFGA